MLIIFSGFQFTAFLIFLWSNTFQYYTSIICLLICFMSELVFNTTLNFCYNVVILFYVNCASVFCSLTPALLRQDSVLFLPLALATPWNLWPHTLVMSDQAVCQLIRRPRWGNLPINALLKREHFNLSHKKNWNTVWVKNQWLVKLDKQNNSWRMLFLLDSLQFIF